MLALLGLVTIVRKIKTNAPTMTGDQIRQYDETCRADETAKSEN